MHKALEPACDDRAPPPGPPQATSGLSHHPAAGPIKVKPLHWKPGLKILGWRIVAGNALPKDFRLRFPDFQILNCQIWWPTGQGNHLDPSMLIFYGKYRCLNSRLRVSCKLDESKCHQALNCSDCLHSFGQSPTSVYWFIVPLPIKFESSHSHPYSEMLQILTTCNCPWDWSCSPLQFDFSTAAMKWDALSSIVWFILLLKHEFKQHLHWNTYKQNKNNSCAALATSLAEDFSDSSRMYKQGTLRVCVLLQRGFQKTLT